MSGCGGCTTGNSYNPGGHYVGIRINEHEDGRVVFCETSGASLEKGQRVIVEGEQGLEYGQVSTLHPLIVKQCQLREARRLVRVASDGDISNYQAKVEREARFFNDTRELASEKRLPLKLVRAEESFDARKYTVFYTCETRVDYRKLVADLALKYPTRIEMRQVGPRDETKMRGGLGPCGLTLCCSTFLKGFHPVTIKMAKNQNLSLNPSKISGMCGRLMCCLAYEDEGGRPSPEALNGGRKPENNFPEAAV
ncbi:MAG: stage 0 sporulation protein [Acidobacteria bacterium]|nr:stage 0 sporulation protein [Acidobacteriota bacterium]MCA1610993.1 stage 0 sporulation protein [Acidobacteriota bacterium]